MNAMIARQKHAPALHLVSCLSKKLDRPARAADLYTSHWFRKARAYVTRLEAPWRILSAKHGLLEAEASIAPYDLTLDSMTPGAREAWADGVMAKLAGLITPAASVVILAGELYREQLVMKLERLGARVEVPLRGLRLGEQLQWFNNHAA